MFPTTNGEMMLVDREDVATIMADMLRTLTDDLAYLRPLAVLGELPITDHQTQVCLFVLLASRYG